jgi:hypothetical protein
LQTFDLLKNTILLTTLLNKYYRNYSVPLGHLRLPLQSAGYLSQSYGKDDEEEHPLSL